MQTQRARDLGLELCRPSGRGCAAGESSRHERVQKKSCAFSCTASGSLSWQASFHTSSPWAASRHRRDTCAARPRSFAACRFASTTSIIVVPSTASRAVPAGVASSSDPSLQDSLSDEYWGPREYLTICPAALAQAGGTLAHPPLPSSGAVVRAGRQQRGALARLAATVLGVWPRDAGAKIRSAGAIQQNTAAFMQL